MLNILFKSKTIIRITNTLLKASNRVLESINTVLKRRRWRGFRFATKPTEAPIWHWHDVCTTLTQRWYGVY